MKLKLKKVVSNRRSNLEHQRLTSLINSMADAVIAVDEKTKVVLYNAAALNILDVNNIKTGVNIEELLKPIDKDNQPVDITKTIKDTNVPITNRDMRVRYSDNSLINLYLSIAPVHLGYGEKGQKGYVLLLRDITREKSLEEERDEFISVVSHELRTPITIAEGNLSNAIFITDKFGATDEIKTALKESHSQVLFLADMINDLSTLSRAERGALQVDIEPIDVEELVNGLRTSYLPEASAKGLELQTSIDQNVDHLLSSRLYVREILQNFLTNALKYTSSGHVTIKATQDSRGTTFHVDDTGIGISKADQERVFDKFFRSEDYRTRQANGTGLGLYVTMKLARLIHAEISLESELNKGSSFRIFIPNLK
ncbi:MAG TPA: ATP-binding protein [Candidatus Saccharimonadales bacterium]|nr:ATP-binding protein [Candidatus Saccharimonadales bacterium]